MEWLRNNGSGIIVGIIITVASKFIYDFLIKSAKSLSKENRGSTKTAIRKSFFKHFPKLRARIVYKRYKKAEIETPTKCPSIPVSEALWAYKELEKGKSVFTESQKQYLLEREKEIVSNYAVGYTTMFPDYGKIARETNEIYKESHLH